MKLLLDENLPHQLRHELPGHDSFTVAYMGWVGVENGELLKRAAAQGFDALVTKDANVRYEQNLVNLPIAVIIVRPHQTISTTFARFCRHCSTR